MNRSIHIFALCACAAALASCAGFDPGRHEEKARETGPGYNRYLQDPSTPPGQQPGATDTAGTTPPAPETPAGAPPQTGAVSSGATPPAGATTTPPAPPPPTNQYPYGKPVPGKKGFVTSPYDEKAGMIDVRDYAPGTKVRDPYTNKIFLVP